MSVPHADTVAPLLLGLAVVLAAAQLGGHLAARFAQPAVLGELLAGILIGNLHLAGVPWFTGIAQDAGLATLAELGVLILLFEVGLESTVSQMLAVGGRSLGVAVLGVAAPFGLGWMVSAWAFPEHSVYVHAFLGAALTATSIGVTARTLKDLGRSRTDEARIILGAAVIDDILGLITLAVVAGVIGAADRGEAPSWSGLAFVGVKAIGFVLGAVAIGGALAPRLFRWAGRLAGRGVLLVTALVLCFGLAYLSTLFGLAPIVGAFAAGLILEPGHFAEFVDRGEHSLEAMVHPVASVLVPVFFVLMGARVDLAAFADLRMLGFAAVLTAAALVGKQACTLGVWRAPLNRLAVGIGMIPRGEVGLIFANIGLGLSVGGERIVDQGLFSAIVIMVIVTTMITPPALAWSFRRNPAGPASVG